MPKKTTTGKPAKTKTPSSSRDTRLDILLAGPLLYVPAIKDGTITDIEVFSPCNDHPIGAVFLPGVYFTDEELADPECERWPEASSFSLLDPHSYSIDLSQKLEKKQRPLAVAAIPETNHKVTPGRRLTSDWTVAINIRGQLANWSSHRLSRVTDGLFHGADAPTTGTVAGMQRLSYNGVTGAEFCGAAKEPREYLRANAAKGGTLIVMGEIPYQSTLRHERQAIDALAKLAGLDLHLVETAPHPYQTRLMNHVTYCGHCLILA